MVSSAFVLHLRQWESLCHHLVHELLDQAVEHLRWFVHKMHKTLIPSGVLGWTNYYVAAFHALYL